MSAPNPFAFGVSPFGVDEFSGTPTGFPIDFTNGGAIDTQGFLPLQNGGWGNVKNSPSVTVSQNISGNPLTVNAPLPVVYPPQTYVISGVTYQSGQLPPSGFIP